MFLKTLTLKGFKSFAESTTLEMEPGVTVVVGPNGSGKSNVVDAVGWVLGAQAPSAVRSQKMDDVIFAGTAKRAALGRAEVALTIDNAAGLLPIDFSEVTITRTLFRAGDSEYAINGVPCRLLDIQELLSDTGVGRQQHVIISQGQIDAVLNARSEDRRLIIEEAAGVLKFRRRKEKAERRLSSTEGNLTRVQDLLREVRRQLRPLERQADAARRHGSLVAELGALRTYVAGQEISRLQARLANGETSRRELAASAKAATDSLASLDSEVLATEARLTAMGADDLGDDLARSESLRERARGLTSLMTERSRGVERDRRAVVDRAVIATLEAEAAQLRLELDEVSTAAEQIAPEAQRLALSEAELAAARERFQSEWAGFEPVAPGGRAAEARGELGALRAGAERGESEAGRVRARLDALDAKSTRLNAEVARWRTELAEAQGLQDPLMTRSKIAGADRGKHEASVSIAEEALRSADADRHAWAARVDALSLALDEARANAGLERLSEIDGVVGTLLDVVAVADGWQAAFEAGVSEAVATVVVADGSAGRRAIETLRATDAPGAVLPLGAESSGGVLPGDGAPARSHDPQSLRAKVSGTRPGVDALLDRLVGQVRVAESWTAALDAVLADPAAIVVTRDGDRFGPTGWRVGLATSGATGAALDEARSHSERAEVVWIAADERVRAARSALADARVAEQEATRSLDRNDARLSAASDAMERVEADTADCAAESESLRAHLAELEARVGTDNERLAGLVAKLPGLEAAESEASSNAREMAETRRSIEDLAASVGSLRREHEVKEASLVERASFLQRRLAEIDERLDRDATERQDAEGRRLEVERRGAATDRLAALVGRRLAEVETAVADLRERRHRQSQAVRSVAADLDRRRRERTEVEKALTGLRERMQRAEIEEAESRLRLENAVEALRRDLDMEPEAARDAAVPDLPDGVSPVARIRELERELRLMGPINPLALEEFEALQERHQFLEGQLEDVKASRRELAKVIKAIDGEIVGVFAAAFADVSMNFQQLFETLFPGGRGRLTLDQPDDLLATGIEIEAKPSGKNVKKLSLLSGGERSLTALAYLFAVFRARPSPFYVMDEVEAALDDVNLHRFLDLVHEFRQDAQLIIVSHQKRTMEAADCLYGVTMEPGGSSRVVSEKVTSDL